VHTKMRDYRIDIRKWTHRNVDPRQSFLGAAQQASWRRVRHEVRVCPVRIKATEISTHSYLFIQYLRLRIRVQLRLRPLLPLPHKFRQDIYNKDPRSNTSFELGFVALNYTVNAWEEIIQKFSQRSITGI
jgi:hypothetical protein